MGRVLAPVDARRVKLTVSGPPRTKKNHRVHTRAGVPLPSKAWTAWVKSAEITMDANGRRYTLAELKGWPLVVWFAQTVGAGKVTDPPYREAYNVRALFYRDAERGDAVGYYQGLADLLEKRGVIANDSQLRSWDGSRLLKDAGNPRVEIELQPLEAS